VFEQVLKKALETPTDNGAQCQDDQCDVPEQ
jgi:hypothetical protein